MKLGNLFPRRPVRPAELVAVSSMDRVDAAGATDHDPETGDVLGFVLVAEGSVHVFEWADDAGEWEVVGSVPTEVMDREG
jgi:hypothetical protein